MTFRTCRALISARTSSLETKLTEKLSLFSYSGAIVRMLEWFLHLTTPFRVG